MSTRVNATEIGRKIGDKMRQQGETQSAVSHRLGLHQSQISRILQGRFKRLSPSVKKLCIDAGVRVDQVSHPQHYVPSQRLVKAIGETWDGTATHEKALLKVLKAVNLIRR